MFRKSNLVVLGGGILLIVFLVLVVSFNLVNRVEDDSRYKTEIRQLKQENSRLLKQLSHSPMLQEQRSTIASLRQENKDLTNQLEKLNQDNKRLGEVSKRSSNGQTAPTATTATGSSAAFLDQDKIDAFSRLVLQREDETRERLRIVDADVLLDFKQRSERDWTRPVIDSEPEFSTGIKCFEMSPTHMRHRFGKHLGKIAGDTVCVFKDLCFDGTYNVMWTPEDTQHLKTYPWTTSQEQSGEFYDFPPCLACGKLKVQATKHETLEELKREKAKKVFIDEPTWLVTLSYQRHTKHFIEHVGLIYEALTRLRVDEDLHGPIQNIHFVNHRAKLLDWQEGVLKAATRDQNIHYTLGPPKSGTCFKTAIVPGYVFHFFGDTEAVYSFRKHVYSTMNSIPEQMPKPEVRKVSFLRRTSKRVLTNYLDVVEMIKSIDASVTVEVVQQSKLSFVDQVKLMASSGLVVGMHGADLTNCVFMRENSIILEINPMNWRDSGYILGCGYAGVKYLSYNDNDPELPWAHFPSIACPDCTFSGRRTNKNANVKADLSKLKAVVLEAYSHLGWIDKGVVYSPFRKDFDLLGVHLVDKPKH